MIQVDLKSLIEDIQEKIPHMTPENRNRIYEKLLHIKSKIAEDRDLRSDTTISSSDDFIDEK